VEAFCKDISAGEGRLAACLTARISAAAKGNVAGREVSGACGEEVVAFKMERVGHINKDVPLGERAGGGS
jgi:hypothetical protein